jgi:hypothetical protein
MVDVAIAASWCFIEMIVRSKGLIALFALVAQALPSRPIGARFAEG